MDIGLILETCGAGVSPALILAATATEPTLLETIGSYLWMILSVGAGLTFVIFVHELGHFLVAKACGVKCERFYVGFDFFEIPIPFTRWKIPRSLVKFQWGETEYGIGSLPLGGYVKMLGQDDDPRNAEKEAERIRVASQGESDQARAQAIAAGKAAEGLVSGQSVEAATKQALAKHEITASELVPAKTTEGKTLLLDPRSYPAKPVPARMAIISAGVIMNLIFAVIMAAVAYRIGVEEAPAIVGGVSPGGPAWENGIKPGSKILQIGRGGSPYEHLRFSDLAPAAMLNGTDRDLPVLVREPNGTETWYRLRPTERLARSEKRPMLGIAPARSLMVVVPAEAVTQLGPQASSPLQDRDRVVSVAGQRVESGAEVSAIFAQNPFGPINITVERQAATASGGSKPTEASQPRRLDITLAPKPLRDLGLIMKIGPIVAIREGSPAADAGFRVGDTILQIDGEPVGDPLGLSQRLVPEPGAPRPITFLVSNKDRERTLTVMPELPLQSPLDMMGASEIMSIESIGVAFQVTNQVAEVTPGSPANQAGIEPNDAITRAEFTRGPDRDAERQLMRLAGFPVFDAVELKGGNGWMRVMSRLQLLLPDNKVKLSWQRGAEAIAAELTPRESTTLFDASRGLNLYGRTETHQAKTFIGAIQLGARETAEQVKQVVAILHSLVTGGISATSLSGPFGIMYVAGSFANEGIAPLLMFLTILSANLAVLNFLPIPALDGGHMLFLTAEWIRGKPVDERLQIRLTIAGVICLLSLMVFATAMDIGRFAEMIQRWF